MFWRRSKHKEKKKNEEKKGKKDKLQEQALQEAQDIEQHKARKKNKEEKEEKELEDKDKRKALEKEKKEISIEELRDKYLKKIEEELHAEEEKNKGITREKRDVELEKLRRLAKKEIEVLEEVSDEEVGTVYTSDYEQFRKQYLPFHLTLYEKACQFAETILKVKLDPKKEKELQGYIRISHLNISPQGAVALAFISPFVVLSIFLILSYITSLPYFTPNLFLLFMGIIFSLLAYYLFSNIPKITAFNWRMKSSNQIILAVFYLATYLRHTPNLEKAIEFTSKHLFPPLGLDFKRILWELESQKYSSVTEALNAYLDEWRDTAPEFVEAIHLLESSLYESDENRRYTLLDKSLDLILEETYEKMLHYSHSLKTPITMIHMLGIVLPILSLVLLPIVVSFMESVRVMYLFFIYNMLLPVVVFIFSRQVLAKRPIGYGGRSIEEILPFIKQKQSRIVKFLGLTKPISAFTMALVVLFPFFMVGISPIVIHTMYPSFDVKFFAQQTPTGEQVGGLAFLGYQKFCTVTIYGEKSCDYKGPFGIGATILSIFLIIGLGMALSTYYKILSKNATKIREEVKKLEKEFSAALFQLASFLEEEIPIETAIKRVAETSHNTTVGKFFEAIYANITKLNYSLERAIFDEKVGAIKYFPSPLVESAMRVLVDTISKGPKIAGRSLMSISTYVRDINRVEERLKDLMADELSNMKTQLSFLAPVISGIVMGITTMITTILLSLQEKLQMIGNIGQGIGSLSTFTSLLDMFRLSIPTYYFQVIVGLYLIEVVYLLTSLINGIENGEDDLAKKDLLGKYLFSSTLLYSMIAIIVIVIFNLLALTITNQALI